MTIFEGRRFKIRRCGRHHSCVYLGGELCVNRHYVIDSQCAMSFVAFRPHVVALS